MKKILFLLTLSVIVLCCMGSAGADGVTISQNGSQSTFIHGTPVSVTYDVKQSAGQHSTFDHAELYVDAWYDQNYYSYDPIRLSGTSGSYSFTYTGIGDRLTFRIVLKDADDDYVADIYGGEAAFADSWGNKPAVPVLSVTRSQASVTAGTPISASYQITGGSGSFTECSVGWTVRDENGWWVTSVMKDNMPANGVLTMESPTAKGIHYVQMSVKDTSGWTFQAEDHAQGIEVTTDGTGEPLDITLTWKDENGKILDWSQDKAERNQQIYLTWQMRGGYTPYEGYFNMTRLSGDASFGSMGQAGPDGSFDFNVWGQQDVLLGIEYHDDHGNNKALNITIRMEDVRLILNGDYSWLDGTASAIDYTVYKGIPLSPNSSYVWQRTDFIKYNISNWDEMKNTYGGSPTWSVQLNKSIPGYREQDEGRRFTGSLEWIPTQAMDAEAVLTCTWGGQSVSRTIRLHVVEPDFSLPAGVDHVQDDYHIQTGDTLSIAPTILPATWSLSGYGPKYFAANGLSDFIDTDNWHLLNNATEAEYTVKNAGVFTDDIGLSYGALLITKEVTFYVTNSAGTTLKLCNSRSQINRYLGMTDNKERDADVFSWNALTGAEIEDYHLLRTQFSGDPVWNVAQMSGDPLPFRWAVENGGQSVDVRLEAQDLTDMNYQPGDAEIRISCTWGGQTVYADTEVHLLYPPNGLPTGIDYNNGSDVVNCQIGDTLMITPTIAPSTWTLPGYNSVYAGNSGEFEEFCSVVDEGTWGRELEVTKAGIYECFVGINTDTITAGRWITYRVADANGVVPVPQPEISGCFSFTDGVDLNQNGTFFVSPGMPLDSNQDGILYSTSSLFTYGVDNWWRIRNEMNGTPTFTVTKISGNISYEYEVWNDNSHVDVFLAGSTVPAAGSAEFEVTCTLDGQNYVQAVHIDFVTLQSRPAGVETDYTDPLIAKVGGQIDYNPSVRFKNGWSIGTNNWSSYGGGDFWDHVDWQYGTWTDAGIYPLQLVARADNLSMSMTVTAVVAEADGTMDVSMYTPFGTVAAVPGGLKKIEAEAFAGTKLTEIDIPAGVEIAADAFDGTGLVAIYCHDQETVDYALQHGFAAVVE